MLFYLKCLSTCNLSIVNSGSTPQNVHLSTGNQQSTVLWQPTHSFPWCSCLLLATKNDDQHHSDRYITYNKVFYLMLCKLKNITQIYIFTRNTSDFNKGVCSSMVVNHRDMGTFSLERPSLSLSPNIIVCDIGPSLAAGPRNPQVQTSYPISDPWLRLFN